MVELNFFNSEGRNIHAFTTLDEISLFFNDRNIDATSPQSFLMYFITNYGRYRLDGIEYYLSKMNIDNVDGSITISYEPA
jgi:hypothetical protein